MNYQLGLETFRKLAYQTEWYRDFAVYEAALSDNLVNESRYGPDEQTRRERARLVDQLNKLALEWLGITFNEMCLNKSPAMQTKTPPNTLQLTISVLFLAADPTDASRLRLGEESREIQEKLQWAKRRERFELHQRMSVRPADISQSLLDVQPQIVHFSGHGTANGALCFENETGKTHLVRPEALSALFEQFANQVNCVLLNACYSETQANAIANHIDYVIGMNQSIGDKAAIAFAIGFYQALGAGRTIEEAYKLGCVQIRLHNIPEHLTPVLIRKGVVLP